MLDCFFGHITLKKYYQQVTQTMVRGPHFCFQWPVRGSNALVNGYVAFVVSAAMGPGRAFMSGMMDGQVMERGA